MPNQTPTQYVEDAHTDLLATLVASRELGPEMDRALVESYLQKHPTAAHSAPAAPAQPTWGALPSAPRVLGGIGFLVGVAIFIAALIASGGHAFWLLWLLVAMGWWWRWLPPYGWWGYHGQGAERRARRDD